MTELRESENEMAANDMTFIRDEISAEEVNLRLR